MALSPLNAAFVRVKFAGNPIESEIPMADFLAALASVGGDAPVTQVNVAGAYELSEPPAGAVGTTKKYHITSSGGGNLTLAAGIVIPSDSGITFPKELTAGEVYIVQIEYMTGGFWMITTVLGGGAA